MDLQPPSVLAQLPHPLHASTGKIRIGEVYSLADSKKRKRYEVAAAIDGEAVNIYNIQTPKLVTSYAVPPQSSFSCRPFSVRRKLSNKSPVKRQTYVAVHHPESQVKCFVEETGSNGTSAPAITSTSFSLKDSSSPAVFLGIVPSGSGKENDHKPDPYDILTVHKDGRVRRLAPDLETQRWSVRHAEFAKADSKREVQACFLVEFEDVKKSLFKRRQDLIALALGDSTSSGDEEEPSVLLLVSHPVGAEKVALKDVTVQIFSVPARTQSDSVLLDENQKLRHLLTVSIPDFDDQRMFKSDSVQWNFHAGSAGLSLSFGQGFVNFDLSQYSPTVTSRFILEDEQFSSVMRISPQSVIGAGKTIVALYDTQYQSIQRSIAIDTVQSGDISGNDDCKARIRFLGYFAKLGIAVATRGNALLAFDLSSLNSASFGSSSLKRQRDGLLIDAIGRGIGSSATQWEAGSKKHRTELMATLGLTSSEQVDKWTRFSQDLEKATMSKDTNAFDNAVQAYFGTASESGTVKLPSADEFVNPEMALFLLSKIFSVKDGKGNGNRNDGEQTARLSVALWPEITCRWLIELGQLSMSNIGVALRRSSKPSILPPFPTGSFSQALAQTDPSSSRHLIQVLQGPVMLDADELAHVLKHFLNKARSHSASLAEITAKAITNDSGTVDDEQKPVSLTTTTAANTLTNTFTGLNLTLQRIHSHPIPSITTSLRSTLTRPETISLLHHLRLSLATGGYTSRFTENPPTPISPDLISPPLHLNTIIDLLIASVDSIGPSGWISAIPATASTTGPGTTPTSSTVEDTREIDLIGDMKSEISAALAGVEEATYLKGILREYLRYGEKVVAASGSNNKQKHNQNQNQNNSMQTESESELKPTTTQPMAQTQHEKINGADLIIFAAPEEDGDTDANGSKLLPLSLTPPTSATDVSKTKLKKSTGEVQSRSHREIGYLRRKAVGKYSFERLLV